MGDSNEIQKPIVYANANAHLDTVWNWTLEDTVKRHLVRTLKENFHLFENYPNYRFNFEGAYRYELIKEYYPEDYETMKGYIAEGKWFVTGSGWENGDVIVSSPEALMRNILYGNRYFMKEFGKKSNDIFLPDCFGFAYTLPTIMNHMGLTAFSSAKLIWNSGNKVPFEVGIWKGVDGSEVVSALDPGQYVTQIHEHWSQSEALAEHIKTLPVHKTFRYYGVGDEGGAPTEGSARYISESVEDQDAKVNVISAYAGQLADELTEEEYKKMPVYDGELLMTTHGVGSYTSVAPTKRFNRKNELMADFAERTNLLASWLGVKEYPREVLEKAWKMVIRHQFHDDITGTSLQKVYTETFTDYITALNQFVHEMATAEEQIVDCIDTAALGEGIPVVVFNGVTADRKEAALAEINFTGEVPAYIQVYNCDGKEVASQILERTETGLKIAFCAEVLSDGYSTYRVVPANQPSNLTTGLSVDQNGLENSQYKVELDAQGNICRIYDKEMQKELLSAPVQYEILDNSYVHYGAWEILYKDICREPRGIVGGMPKIEILENGPVRVAIKVTRMNGVSTYTQIIRLFAGANYVNVENNINWLEQSAFLKVRFPLNVANEKATYDMGLGTIERGNNEEMKYEVPVHQWANLQDASSDYSITIMNDCKYGMDKPEDNVMRLTAIHTPQNKFLDATRQDVQDFGENRFSYAIMGQSSDWKTGNAVVHGAAYNQPLVAVQTTSHGGILPAEFSFVSISNKQVAVKAVKLAEDSDEVIVRVYEMFGESARNVKLQMAGGIISAREVNGFEEHIADASVEDGVLVFDMQPHKPKTFALKLAGCTAGLSQKGYETISLPCNTLISSLNERKGEYGFYDEKVTIPAELFPSALVVGAVPFSIQTETTGIHSGLISDGQVLELPANATRVYFMAAGLKGDVTASFQIGGQSVDLPVQSTDSYIGGWDQYGSDHYGYIKQDVVAYSASHIHDISGDNVYGKFCLFKYMVDIPAGVKTITLPKGKDVLIAAATALVGNAGMSRLATQIIDVKEKREKRMLTVNDGTGSGEYVEGNPVSIIYTGSKTGEVTWTSSTGEIYQGMALELSMPDKSFTLTPVVKEYGENLALHCEAVASGEIDANTAASVTDGKQDTLWKTLSPKSTWIILDLGEPKALDTVLIRHAGAVEGNNTLNTVNYQIQVFQDGQWVTYKEVKGNRLAITAHTIEPVCTQYLRLLIDKPTFSESDKCTRIYGVEVYNQSGFAAQRPLEEVTPFDIIDEAGDGTIVFRGNVELDTVVDLKDKNLIRKWSVSNMKSCELYAGKTEDSLQCIDKASKKKLNEIHRIISGKEASYIKITGVPEDSGKPCEVTLIGKSLSMVLNNSWPAERAGTRNNYAVKSEKEGTLFLPKDENGGGHDVFGLGSHVKAGPIRLYMCIKITEEAMAGAEDSLVLFTFNPILPGGDVSGKTITLGDYKNAPENEAGCKIVSSDFVLAADGEIEGRISSERNLDMTVYEFGVYESQQ